MKLDLTGRVVIATSQRGGETFSLSVRGGSFSLLSLARMPREVKRASLVCIADVCVQLVMQMLDAPSLYCFSRCSRQMLHAASHTFGWLYAPRKVPSTLVRQFSGGLIRFRPIHLIWHQDESSIEDTLQECISFRNITSVTCVEHEYDDCSAWLLPLLSSPQLQQVHCLDLGRRPLPGMVDISCQLQSLRTLRIVLHGLVDAARWLSFMACNLTDLQLSFYSVTRQQLALSDLASIRTLERLTISRLSPGYSCDSLKSHEFTSIVHELPPHATGCGSFTCLHTVVLSNVGRYMDGLIHLFTSAPALRTLCMTTCEELYPSVSAIKTLLESNTKVLCRLQYDTSVYGYNPNSDTMFIAGHYPREAHTLQQWWNDLRALSHRLVVKQAVSFQTSIFMQLD
jgi:hypothetical protein